MARFWPGVAGLPARVGGGARAASRRDGRSAPRRAARATATRPRAVLLPQSRGHERGRRAGCDRRRTDPRGPDRLRRRPAIGRRVTYPRDVRRLAVALVVAFVLPATAHAAAPAAAAEIRDSNGALLSQIGVG